MFVPCCDCAGMNSTNTWTFDFEKGLQIDRYMSWACKDFLVCMCRLSLSCMYDVQDNRDDILCPQRRELLAIFLVCHFEVEQNTWRYTQVQVGEYAECGGSWCGDVDCVTFGAQGNVQWRLVCVVVNLRIFSTRRMNSLMIISVRKRTPRFTIKVQGLQDVEHLRRTVKQELAFVSDTMRYLWKSNFKTVTSILANFEFIVQIWTVIPFYRTVICCTDDFFCFCVVIESSIEVRNWE